MTKSIKITQSPFNPSLEIVDDVVVKLHVPYSDKSVTIQINPNIQEYQENAGTENAQVHQLIETTLTDQTKTFKLDLQNNKKKKFSIGGGNYEIELTTIGKEKIQDQDFLYYEFNVSKG